MSQSQSFALLSQVRHLHTTIVVLFWQQIFVIAEANSLNQYPFTSSPRLSEAAQATTDQTYT